MNRLIACVQAYNEENMLKYSIPSIYNDVDEIILIDGAVEGWFPTIHSTDDTVEIAKSFDVDKKMTIVQIDRYWQSLEELKHEFAKYVPNGDYFCIIDADELYTEGDLTRLRKLINARPNYTDWIPIFYEFAFDLHHVLSPEPGFCNLTNQRVVKAEPGGRWDLHHPTLALPDSGTYRDSALDHKYDDRRIVVPDFPIFHLSCTKPIEFQIEKHMRYFTTFEKLSTEEARKKADGRIEILKNKIMDYDGPLPKVLLDHPLYKNRVIQEDQDNPHRNYLSCMEYYDTTKIPLVYNLEWSPPPKVSVVITCYNNLDVLKCTLPVWQTVRCSDFEVIVVEDGEPEGAVTGIKEYVESLSTDRLQYRYYHNDSGSSYCISSARNIGIWNSTGSRVIFTDSDIVPEPYFIMEHIVNSDGNNITVGARNRLAKFVASDDTLTPIDIMLRVTRGWGRGTVDLDYFELTDTEMHVDSGEWTCDVEVIPDPRIDGAFKTIDKGRSLDPWEHCHGANMSMDRKQLIDINGFDETAYDGKWGAEDVDVAFRLIRKGLKVKPVPKSIGYHIDHPTRNTGGQRETLNKLMVTDIVRARPKSWV